ncbi:MAG: ATP-binding protein [Flavobacteriales bacterium]|jgi:predicted AAA+ superfamily ATPase
MINRDLTQIVAELRKKGKAIVITGPRQVGKTTLLKSLFGSTKNVLWLDGDDATIRERLKNAGTAFLKTLVGDNTIVVIDEAQRIHEVGLVGKQLVDQMPDVELFITGSSALELSGMTNEPMTGRKWSLQLYPLSFREMVRHQGLIDELSHLKQRLIYGYYPEIVVQSGREERRLKELSESYLYKDIYAIEKIQKPEKFERLLKLLAFQIGQQVSNHELAINTGLDVSTVERYIDLLEKAFVVFRVPSFQRNKRNELKKSRKIYFVDNGMRNAIIEQWSSVDMRADAGMLWENWVMSERRKLINNEQASVSAYFWRTTAQQEVDLIEESAAGLKAFEFKWNEKARGAVSTAFTSAYPEATTNLITPKNFETFLMEI